jgi:raffinose/stachyose/melibiose transport system substrate-binding protein
MIRGDIHRGRSLRERGIGRIVLLQIADAGFVQALERFKAFNDAGFFNEDAVSIDSSEARQIYYAGEAAMMIDGSWGVGAITREAPEEIVDATRVATMPAVPRGSGQPGVLTGGSGWSYASNTRLSGPTLDAVVALAKQLTSIEVAKMTIETNSMSPIRKELVPFDAAKIHPLQERMNDLMSSAPVLATMYAVQVNPAVADVLYRKTQELMIGAATPQEVADEAQRTYERSW